MVLAEGKRGNAGGQDSVGVWSAHAWPLWDVFVEWSRGAGSRLNSLRCCPDGLEFTPVGDEEDRVQESQFKAGGLAGMALQWGQGHMEEVRGSGNTLEGLSKGQGQRSVSRGPSRCGGAHPGWRMGLEPVHREEAAGTCHWDWVALLEEHGSEEGVWWGSTFTHQ